MLARCARCQGTFTTDRYGRQSCPNCGAELILPAPPGTPEDQAAPPPAEPPASPPPRAPAGASGGFGPPAGQGPTGWPPQGGGGWGAPPPPPMSGADIPSPFAERRRLGFFTAFFETWKLVATQPERFFGRVRSDQAWTAVLFGVLAATVGNALASVYAYFSSQQALVSFQQMAEKMPDEQARIVRMYAQMYAGAFTGPAIAAQVVLAPVVAFILIYVVSAVIHLVLMLLKGTPRGFDATLTTVGYAAGLLLLLAVPACGSLLAFIWAAVSLVVGLGAIQRCGTGKAAAAVLAPFALACVCCCGLVGLSAPAIMKAMAGAAAASKGAPTTDL